MGKGQTQDITSKSWFAVFNNPADHGYSGIPEEICNRLKEEWIKDSDSRSGAWVYCISASGLHHVHMVLEDQKTMRFSKIKSSYALGMHFEVTKGTKKDVEDYVEKKGKFAEKGEEIVYKVEYGEIKGRQGKRTDLSKYYDMILEGHSPAYIIKEDINALRYKNQLRDMYFMYRSGQTPFARPVRVYWHTGESGSGKSYSRYQLFEKYGEDNIYYLTAFNAGAFDNYIGQPVLWIEDYRGEFNYSLFLRLLDVYKAEIPCRYINGKALWVEVHITSIYTPMQCYADHCNSHDSIRQLLRRITSLVYHYKVGEEYCVSYFSPETTFNDMFKYCQKYLKGCPRSYENSESISLDDLGDFYEVSDEPEDISVDSILF